MKSSYISLDPLIPWLDIERPIKMSRIFSRSGPVEVEIGFGQAEYLVQRASLLADHNFIGIEMAWLSIKKGLRKIALNDLHNIRLIQGDARVIFEKVFGEQCIDKVCSLFPCPWPKKKHTKHRLFSTPFLRLLNNRLVANGKVLIVTDFMPYFEWILSQTENTGFEVLTREIPPQFETKYERKWQDLGQKSFYELCRKKTTHVHVETQEEVALKTYRVEKFSPHLFHPKPFRNHIVVEFKEQLFDQIRQKAMIRALVVEGNFAQNFWIEVLRKGNFWHIRPAKGCSILPTAGIQKALDLVFEAAKCAVCSEEH